MFDLNNICCYNEATTREALQSLGLDASDMEELALNLVSDEVEELEYGASIAAEKAGQYERSCDHYRACLNEIMNMTDELSKMQRRSKQRVDEYLQSVERLINEYI